MRIQILHNQNERESFVRGYKFGDKLVRMCHRTMETDGLPRKLEALLEHIYMNNQHLEGQSPWYEGRSLSKGDVICINNKAYAVASIGFQEIALEVPYV